jgi:hypothetical protein
MNRRSFLRTGVGALGAAVAAPVLGPLAAAVAVPNQGFYLKFDERELLRGDLPRLPRVYGEQRASGTVIYRHFDPEEMAIIFQVPVRMLGVL